MSFIKTSESSGEGFRDLFLSQIHRAAFMKPSLAHLYGEPAGLFSSFLKHEVISVQTIWGSKMLI